MIGLKPSVLRVLKTSIKKYTISINVTIQLSNTLRIQEEYFDSQYGVHSPISEPKDKSLQWGVKSNSYKIIAELDYLASSLQMMDAMGNKLSPKSASLVSDMMEAHGRFCNDVMNFNDSVWKVIRAGITEENIPHTRGYVNGDYMTILTSMDEPVRISFKLKEISFKDFYLHETTMQSVITRLKSLIARTGKNRT